MKKAISFAAMAACCGLVWGTGRLPQLPIVSAQSGGAAPYDWITDGGDNQRTGWNKDEKTLTKDNVKNLKLLWKMPTGNQVRALHSLMPVLVVGQLTTPAGAKQVGFVNGISDNLYAFDVDTGKILWQKHWDYPPPVGRGGGGGGRGGPTDPAHLGFLQPGGSSDTPVIGPADAQGRRPVYFVTGDGMLHTLNAATGDDLQPAFMFHTGKGWALNLVGNVIWMANTYAGDSVSAVRLDDPAHKVMTFNAGSGGAWGRRGAVHRLDRHRVVHDRRRRLRSGERSAALRQQHRRRADDRRRAQAEGLLHAHELGLAAQARSRSEQHADDLHLQGPRADGRLRQGMPRVSARSEVARRRRSSDAALQDAALLQRGSGLPGRRQLGRVSNWEDSSGTRWVLAPFWGPAHPQAKFPIMNTPPTKDGGVAAFKVEDKGGKLELTPAWISRDMQRGEPVIIANGMVFGYGSGEETKQSFPDIGLQFDSSIRASKGTHATIYALDAQTGKELWSSGDQMHQWNHFSGVTVANGHVYPGTYDQYVWCFRAAIEPVPEMRS